MTARQIKFEGVPAAAVSDLIEFLHDHSAFTSTSVINWRMSGRAEHAMGEITFTYEILTSELIVVIERSAFPGSMMLGGIRQHVEEAIEKYSRGRNLCGERPQIPEAPTQGGVANL